MREFLVKGNTLPDAFHQAILILQNEGEVLDCPDWNTRCKEVAMTFCVEHPLEEPRVSRVAFCTPDALKKYLDEMLDGALDWAIAEGKEPYTYHDRMVNMNGIDQLDFVVEELRKNPLSRRACVMVRSIADIGNSDPACLQHLQFMVHDGKLDLAILFRSNDACKATFMNAFALIEIQKRIADRLGIPVGTYTHRATSFHSYESDWEMLEGAAKRIEEGKRLTFTYEQYRKMETK